MMHVQLVAVVSCAALVLSGTPLRAQALLHGRVLDDSTRAPLAEVELLLEDRILGRSDEAGNYVLAALGPGIHFITFRRIGYRPVRVRAILTEQDTVSRTITMARAVVELPPLEVTASAVPPGMERFAERRANGRGTYFDWKFLRQKEHSRLPELLSRVPGIRPVYTTDPRTKRSVTVMATRRGGGGFYKEQCFMAVYLDGVPVFQPTAGVGSGPSHDPPDILSYRIRDLEAVEVYEGPAQLPPEIGGTGGHCGALVLWSRRR